MTENIDIKKRFKIILPNEWSNRDKGKFWEDVAAPLFRQQRWEVVKDVEFDGMQTDIYVKNIDYAAKGLVECKFHKEPIDAPTIYKLMGQAYNEKVQFAFLLSTSELNPKAKGVIEKHHNDGFHLVVWSSEELVEVFMNIKNIKLPELKQKDIGQVATVTLLVTHTKDFLWVAEKIGEDGEPCTAIIFPITDNKFSIEEWKTYFSRNEIWQGLEVTVVETSQTHSIQKLDQQSI